MPYYALPTTGVVPDSANSFSDHVLYLIARDAKDKITPNANQRTTLIVAASYILAIGILWYVRCSFLCQVAGSNKPHWTIGTSRI